MMAGKRNGKQSVRSIGLIERNFIMHRVFKLQDLDCANCAAKMERAISKIDGVNSARMNFMTQKLTLDADDERFDEIMGQVVTACKRVEPDMVIMR